jgi:hypothetical protein
MVWYWREMGRVRAVKDWEGAPEQGESKWIKMLLMALLKKTIFK